MTNITVTGPEVAVVQVTGPDAVEVKIIQETVQVAVFGGGDIGTTYQFAASTLWVVVHNRNYRPSVTCTDTGGEEITGQVVHISLTEVHITHQFNQAGTVYIY